MWQGLVDIVIKPSFKKMIQRAFADDTIFAREILEMDTHEEQDECLHMMRGKEHMGITTGNRWGKGEVVLIKGCHVCFYKPVPEKFKEKNLSILNTSISQDQANIVFDKFMETAVDKPKFNWLIKEIKKSPFPHIIFKNGMTWWFRNASQGGKYLEGRSYLWANFDEADLQNNLKEFLEDILWPRLWDVGGFLSWTTTARRGKRNAFKVWDHLNKQIKAGDNTLGIYRGDSRKNKFLHESAIVRMNKLPLRLLNKNVKGMYEDSQGDIHHEMLDYCELISDGLKTKPEAGARYVHSWDFARKTTFNVGVTLELSEPLQLVSFERTQDNKSNKNKQYWQLIANRVRNRQNLWKGKTAIDGTGIGDVMDSFLYDIKPTSVLLASKVRNDIIETGMLCIQTGGIGIPLSQMQQVLNGEFWSAKDELIDFDREALDEIIWDFVCALFIGIWIAKGHHYKKKSKKSIPPRVQPMAKGVTRHVV